uniref:alpha-1,6-mannosyl-glycoprotein 6-beta-N-acetylglucosaminyltransferase n=1 Tax=Hucho hucho TaxID=62062 RepID=A0A4W5PC63_9TELE
MCFCPTVKDGATGQCEVPKDPRYPDCPSKVDWMRARWTSDPCYAFYGVDGSDCSFLIYLSEVEWFCPPLTWRNQTTTPTHKPFPKRQSLSFMKRRMRRLAAQWASAARRLDDSLRSQWREQKRVSILVHVGFLTEESGDVFSPKVLKGGPLGEMVQWADILTALHVLGHNLKISVSLKELFLGVPPGRGSCPLTGPLPFDLIYTDYHGLQQMRQHMGLSLRKHKCHIRVIDTFGTEPAYNHEDYATLHGYRTNWGYWNLNCRQYMTMFPHTPDNSFMGFVAEELNDTERLSIQKNKVDSMAVVYGKEASMWKGKEKFLAILHRYMEIHGTVFYETQRPPEVPAFVKNHGLLPQQELQQLLRKAKLFIGFGFPYEGPAPLEAIANGCIFLQPKFKPSHSSLNHEFFRGKPTSRQVSGLSLWCQWTVSILSRKLMLVSELVQGRPQPDSCVSLLVAVIVLIPPSGLLTAEMNHIFPAFSVESSECGLQKDPLLFSCAGANTKYHRLCPCRDYRKGQVALCRDCL